MKSLLQDIHYDLYLISLVGLTLLSFIGPMQPYLMPLLVGVGFLFILGGKSIFYIIPLPFFIQMSFSDLRDNVTVTAIYSSIFAVLILIDLLKNRSIKRRGVLTIPLLVMVGVSILTHINSPDLFTTFAGFVQIFSVFVLYFYFINTMENTEDNFKHIAKLMMYVSVLVSLQMMYVIYESGELATTVIRSRQIDLGWENLNVIIYANLVSIPLIAYLIHESKIKIFYMIFAIISMIGIFLTLSRSSVLTLGVFVVLLVPLMFILSKQRWYLIGQGIALIVMVGLVTYYAEHQYELVSGYIEALQSRDLTYMDDRSAILYVAWDMFKEYPILGSGGLYSSRIHLADAGFGALNYHNTVAQASTLGITGLAAFFYLFAKKTEMIMLSKSEFKWYVLLMIFVTAFVNGTLQPMYFYATYMVFIFLAIAAIEVQLPRRNED